MTDLATAALKHDTAAIERVLKELSIHGVQNHYGMDAINTVLLHDDEKALQLLLQCKVDIDFQYRGETALLKATRERRLQAMSLLLKARANVDIGDDCRWTALHWACVRYEYDKTSTWSHADAVRQLLSARANPNIESDTGKTPLMLTFADHDYALSQMMISDYGALVNVPTKLGLTPLMVAAEHAESKHEVETIQLLLSRQADPTVKARNGATALLCSVWKRKWWVPAYIPTLKLLLRDEFEMDLHAKVKDFGTLLSLSERDPPAHQLITAAIKRRRQWQRIVLLTMSIRATRDVGPFRYSILPLARSIIALVG